MADFVLGRLKFNWRGNWAASTSYIKDDIIKYGANTYTCLVNHTSQSTTPNFYTDLSSAYWSLHSEGLAFAGDWTAATFYRLNDLVKYGAYQYRCILQHTSGGSFAIGSNWVVYSEGLQFEDTYNSGTTYQDGDVVNYGGYTYVYVNATPAAGQTPTDNAYWDILTTGFKMQGAYSSGTAYKTGDVVKYGGNTYVFDVNTTPGQLPTNASYADLLVEGISLQGVWSSVTNYKIGEVVVYQNSSYRAIRDTVDDVPSTSAADWALYNQGDPAGVLTTRGDLITRGDVGVIRLPVGRSGTVLVSNGTDVLWNEISNSTNIIHVAPSGNDTTGDGSEFLPYKTIKKASQQTNRNGISTVDTLSGGTGGTPGVYRGVSGTGGSGTGATFEIVKDGSSTASLTIMNQGSGFAVGNTITISSGVLGGGTDFTFNIAAVTNGDLITEIRYGEILDYHRTHSAFATMAVRSHEFKNPFGVVEIRNLEICGYEEKPITISQINAGIYVLSPKSLDLLQKGEACDMSTFFQCMLAESRKVVAYPIYEDWRDIGNPNDLMEARIIHQQKVKDV